MKMICDVPDDVIESIRRCNWCGSDLVAKMIASGIPLSNSENPNKWIPVSKSLPKENERCLCSYKDEEGECVDFGLFKNGTWYVKGVVAWMPLPEPYKKEAKE